MAANKDTRQLIKRLEAMGWEIIDRRHRTSHLMLRHPDSRQLLTISSTPTDRHATANTLATARRLTR